MKAAAIVVALVLVLAGSVQSQTSQVIKGKHQPVAVTVRPPGPAPSVRLQQSLPS